MKLCANLPWELCRECPPQDEMNDMTEMLEEALLNGAFGMSTGLAYPPGAYAEKEELYQLCKVLKNTTGYMRLICGMREDIS